MLISTLGFWDCLLCYEQSLDVDSRRCCSRDGLGKLQWFVLKGPRFFRQAIPLLTSRRVNNGNFQKNEKS